MLPRLILFLIIGSLAGCSAVSPNAATPFAIATRFSTKKDVIYTSPTWPQTLRADIYQPTGEGPWPGVLLIYGGNWNSDDHRWQMKLLARQLAARGFVVMNAAYRGTPEFRYPAPVEDLQEALRWFRAHAAEHRLNPNAVATYGFSAGGHLAAFLGTVDGAADVRVQAVVAASAPLDLTLFPGGEILPRFLGATFAENPELFRAASPITHVTSDDPPVFLYHGTDDKTVYPQHTRLFKAALDRAGVRNDVRWIEGRGHATTLLLGGDAQAAAIDFLDSALRRPTAAPAR